MPFNHSRASAADCRSMAPIVYTTEGEKVSEQLWKETMEELAFAHVEDVLRDINA